jgi:phosphatidylserine/phosphatidylglycerophosphate/cardiolipin synthase-like enzyme
VNLRERLIAYINRATFSLDCAFYSFSDAPVTDALIAKWNSGVKIRLILDAENSQAQADRLRILGVPVITSTYGGNHASGIHHNKFVLCDARDAATGNDWVWSGSTNCSTDQLLIDPNNAFEIQDFGLTQAFLVEFDEQWGSSTDAPSAANARMGSAKSDNTPHFFNVNGIPIEVWFSPSDGTDAKIAGYVSTTADYGVAYSILAFTSDPIADAMRAKYESVPGFYVRGVHEAAQSSGTGSEYPEMKGFGGADPWSPAADVWIDAESGMHHHKYLIIDEGRAASDPILISGSHNWSNAANTVNDENTVVFHDQRIANLFMQEFRARYTAAGGAVDFTVGVPPVVAGTLAFAAPTPNPTPGGRTTTFALSVPAGMPAGERLILELYSAAGRRVRTLVDRSVAAGSISVAWDGVDEGGRDVPPGIYFARASLAGSQVVRKVVRIP